MIVSPVSGFVDVLKVGSSSANLTKASPSLFWSAFVLGSIANTRKEIDEVYAGDIAAAVGFKNTTTGDTLCAENDSFAESPAYNGLCGWYIKRK